MAWVRLTSPQNPGNSKLMRWIGEHLDYQSDECLMWPFGRRRNGYGQLGVAHSKGCDAHRFICIQVHGEPPTPDHQASHSCGNGQLGCVNPRHLRWATRSENLREARPRPRYKLTPDQALAIRALAGAEISSVTAERYGISEANVRRIQTGKAWKDGSYSWNRRVFEN